MGSSPWCWDRGAEALLEPQQTPGSMEWELAGSHSVTSWGKASSSWEGENGREGKARVVDSALVYSSGLCLTLEPGHI